MGKLALFAVAVLGASVVLLSQVHTHSHDTEPAYYKYTREANEEAVREVHSHSHEHHGHTHDSHGHTHDHHGHSHDDHHGHTHDHHGHTHDHHEHSHEEPHGHSHGEGGCPYAHGHEEYDEDAYYYGSDDEEHFAHVHDEHEHDHVAKPTPSAKSAKSVWTKTPYDPNGPLAFLNDIRTRLWVYSIGSTLLISIAPFLILSVIPIQANTTESAPLLKVLLAFGSGGLLGDAFLHLIPHAQPAGEGHAHSHSHSHAHSHGEGHAHAPHDMLVGGCVLGGIITFLTVEKIVRIFRGEEGHSHSHSHGHGHSHPHDASKPEDESKKTTDVKKKKEKKDKQSDASSAEDSGSEHDKDHESHDDDEEPEEHHERAELISGRQTGFKVAAYLNLAADFAHNITDGLAIGASFLAGPTVGVVTMITVLVHEVPHEIGDFAILVQSGFSKKRAMFVQLLTALGAITGCVVSLWAAEAYGDLSESASTAPVLAFTAGGFIYIALVSVIPELLENTSFWQSVKESFGMMLGIYLMYLIGLYE